MISIVSLWLPIVLSAIAVFVVSSVVHMVLKYHQSDYRALPNESEVLTALRTHELPPGLYTFPHCESMKEMGSPEMLAKYEKGPVGMLTVMPSGPPKMGKFLSQWFVYCLVVGVFVAYLASRTLSAGTDPMHVIRITATTAFLAYGLAELVGPIWKGATWSATLKSVLDGLLYGLATGAVFAWLWPA